MTRTAHSLRRRLARAPFGSLALAALLANGTPAAAQQPDLKQLSIEELMRIDVTTAARREQPVGTTAAAIAVITNEEIRRAGVTTIADALRLADGLQVARVNNGVWSISARGFQGAGNKLLVMVDGRTVYSPFFAGVFWNMLDYLLEDVDRIEVIRGPGTVLWGANAVNGVINIITRHSGDTQGLYASFTSGTEDPAIAGVRYGARAGDATWRVYGKFAARDDQTLTIGTPANDALRRGQGGFRFDGARGGTAWLVQGDAFHSREDIPNGNTGEFTDLALQGRWSVIREASRLDIQSYYRREYRRVPEQLTHHIDVFDIDAQHATRLGVRHDVVWGGGLRVNHDATSGSALLSFDPAGRTYGVYNAFVQDEIAIVPGRLSTILGIKYEHNAFSGGEFQPNVRARLTMSRNQVLWGGFSRAVRRPTRFDNDLSVSFPAGLLVLEGTGDFKAEKLHAFEVGYRAQPITALSFDATVFHHDYADLRSQESPVTGILPLTVGNTLEGRSRGLELGANAQPVSWWRTHVGVTLLDTLIERQPGSRDISGGAGETNDPGHIVNVHSSLDLPRQVEVDALWRSVGERADPDVAAYRELTLRAAWRPVTTLELFVVGEDVLHPRHPESGIAERVEIERAVRVGATVRF